MATTKFQLNVWEEQKVKMRAKMTARLAEMPPGSSSASENLACFCSPDCPECGGTGYVRANPDADVTDAGFGKVKVCSRFRAAEVKTMDPRGYGLTQDEMSLDWKEVRYKMGGVALAGRKAVDAVKPALEREFGMVALLGTFGQGKTLVGKILIARALNTGKRAAYANMSRILNDIRAAFDEKESMTRELIRKMEWWNALDVLFVDELDKVNETGWAQSTMFEVLDRRYVRAVRQEALTVIGSNKKDDELDGYLVSRLHDRRVSQIVYLEGEDARPFMPDGYIH